MINKRVSAAAATVALFACFAGPASAVLNDTKGMNPLMCHPLGPGTAIGELTFNSYGIFNPGVSNEQVICPITLDADTAYSATPGASAKVRVFYRAGAVAGKVACTVYTGSQVTLPVATYTQTISPPALVAGARSSMLLDLAEVSGNYGGPPQTTLLCTINPKAAIGTIYLYETMVTNTP